MRPLLIATALLIAQPAFAQLAPHNEAGVTFGHVHLSVADPKVHHQMWVEQFGGVVATKGTFTIVKLPNMMIAFRGTKPTGGTETTALNHFGLKVPSIANAIAKWKAAGYEVQREFKGSEGFPNAFLIGPDGLRFELQEDTTLKAPAVAYHLHFQVPEPAKLRDWYVDTYGLKAGKQGNFEVAEAPGMRLLFAPSKEAPTMGTRGTTVDHIGFEIRNLAEFLKKLEAKGIKLETAYREVPAIGLNISYLYDPLNVYIEMTEGYTDEESKSRRVEESKSRRVERVERVGAMAVSCRLVLFMGGLIDLRTWKRRDHYLWFRNYAQPFFSVTVDVDVTPVWNKCRKPGAPSFFLSSVFPMLKAANDVEAFRLRLRPRGVWRHDRVAVGPTIMRPDDTFGFVRLEPAASFEEFAAHSRAAIARAAERKALAPSKKTTDDIIFQSVLPWLRFTSFTNALPGKGDSIPRVVFGQCARQGSRMTMPVAVEVHHALVDGLDVARFFERFGGYLHSSADL